jgi:hypothetical protein
VENLALWNVNDWPLFHMDDKLQSLKVFPKFSLLKRRTSVRLSISCGSSGKHILYLQHPNLSTKDEPSLLRVSPVAFLPKS